MGETKMDLATILESGEDWATYATSVAGVYVQKLPASKKLPARLSVNLNPVGSNGQPTKKRGYTVRSLSELVAIREVANQEKIETLLEMVAKANGGVVPTDDEQTIIEI
jgi:hypothetical protein